PWTAANPGICGTLRPSQRGRHRKGHRTGRRGQAEAPGSTEPGNEACGDSRRERPAPPGEHGRRSQRSTLEARRGGRRGRLDHGSSTPYQRRTTRLSGGGFVLLDYTDSADPSLVYLEGRTSGTFLEKPEEVDAYRNVFASLTESALTESQSSKLLKQLQKET